MPISQRPPRTDRAPVAPDRDPAPAQDSDPAGAPRRPWSPALHRLLGPDARARTRVSQSLLGVPSLLLVQAVLILHWQQGELGGTALAWFIGLTLAGCLAFVLVLRSGLCERLSAEPSLSAPQMGYAMLCVGWGYALAGADRGLLLCLMPVILCFGLFALRPRAARALALFGVATLGTEMVALASLAPGRFPPVEEATHACFLVMSLAMVQALSHRLGRIRARLQTRTVELADALERISVLATQDALTGLLNRRAAHEELRRSAGLAARTGRPLVLALADLDHFKRVNDQFGHQVGDRVLQLFARAAQCELRSADRVVRWGGEEFLFVLPDTDEEEASVALQRLREVFGSARADGVPPDVRLGFSAGVARCLGVHDIEAAIERADQGLYRAKQAGRGCTHGDARAEDRADALVGA